MNERQLALEQICRQFGVQALYSFGSRAGEVRDWFEEHADALSPGTSDVDIGAKGTPGKKWSIAEKVHLAGELERLLGEFRVDLVILSEADPFVAAEIIRGEKLFVEDTRLADEYELYILRRAGDLAFLERERMALVLGDRP